VARGGRRARVTRPAAKATLLQRRASAEEAAHQRSRIAGRVAAAQRMHAWCGRAGSLRARPQSARCAALCSVAACACVMHDACMGKRASAVQMAMQAIRSGWRG
jgi:hypothetical protein